MLINLDDKVVAVLQKLAKEDEMDPMVLLVQLINHEDARRHLDFSVKTGFSRCRCPRKDCQEIGTPPAPDYGN